MPDNDSEKSGVSRDPEDRPAANEHELREKMLDKTLADSFPTSDPPSTIPDPAGEDSLAVNSANFQNESNNENADERRNPRCAGSQQNQLERSSNNPLLD